MPQDLYKYYPSAASTDEWCRGILAECAKVKLKAKKLDICNIKEQFGNNPNTLVNSYYEFSAEGRATFYGYWQPSYTDKAPLLINLPGYGGYISTHAQLCDEGFHILHISPRGYVTPSGARDDMRLASGNWPVLVNTARGQEGGYRDWLCDCVLAILWAANLQQVISDKISLFGTSQGGGTALLLASILQDKISCVCADLPFLTAIADTQLKGEAYGLLTDTYDEMPHESFWRNVGMVDTISHAHRLHLPIMLCAGGKDDVCPANTVEKLFGLLQGTKQYTFLENQVHTHSRSSMFLFKAWLNMYGK